MYAMCEVVETIKIINLLNKISNGEELPKKIKYNGYIFEYDTNHKRYESYFDEQIWTLNDFINVNDSLNDEVEIIKEKKLPEKIEYYDDSIAWVIDGVGQLSDVDKVIIDKLNDVIDYFKSKERGDE